VAAVTAVVLEDKLGTGPGVEMEHYFFGLENADASVATLLQLRLDIVEDTTWR
jgi:hypothetical protein